MCRSGNRARRSPSLNLSLPNNVSMGFGGAGLQGRSTSRSPPATPARTAGKGPASPPAGAPLGPNPAVSNGATPHLLPPCLPVPLASGTPRGDGGQVRRRCCRPKQVHGRGPDLDCHRPPLPPLSLPPPPRPKSPPSRPSATATSANLLPCFKHWGCVLNRQTLALMEFIFLWWERKRNKIKEILVCYMVTN
nr:WW domain-binding protein 11-like [Desmodus rotundus]